MGGSRVVHRVPVNPPPPLQQFTDFNRTYLINNLYKIRLKQPEKLSSLAVGHHAVTLAARLWAWFSKIGVVLY